MMPYQPYSKALTRLQEKERSRSYDRTRAAPGSSHAAPFALNMEHGLRRAHLYPPAHPAQLPMPEEEMGQHLIAEAEKKLLATGEVGRQFRRKPKVVVPNCAQVIP